MFLTSFHKKYKYFIYSFLFFLIFLELFSYIYFSVISNDQNNLKNYIEKRNGALSYKYFQDFDLVLPAPNVNIIHYTSEFTDNFLTNDILGLGVGFFDDGIDDRKYKGVAIGDSFTRGVGSTDNLKNGWVELVEKQNTETDLINLGNLGRGLNDQVYHYNKIKKFIKHDFILYNFLSGGDYTDSLEDTSYSFYISKNYEEFGSVKSQEIINDLMTRHGYKHHLEYLKNSNLKLYSVYFFLKIIDLLNNKKLINTHKFKYDIPINLTRLNTISDELFNIKNNQKKICQKKYCYFEDDVFENLKLKDLIIKNTAEKINDLFQQTTNENKSFFLIIHPSSRNFYPKETNINYNDLDAQLISLLNNKIKILYLKEYLYNYEKNNMNLAVFHKHDGHYNINGYKQVSNYISKFLNTSLINKEN